MDFFTALACAFIYYLTNSTWFTDVGFVTINRPFISCALVGVVMGDIATGVELGARINLLYFGFIAAGGAIPSDTGLAGVSGAVIGILLKPYIGIDDYSIGFMGADHLSFGLVAGVLLGMPGKLLWDRRMHWNSAFARRAAKCAAEGDLRGLARWNVYVPQLVSAAATVPWATALFMVLGMPAVLQPLSGALATISRPIGIAAFLLPCLGLAVNLRSIGNKRTFPYFFIGYATCVAIRIIIKSITFTYSIGIILIVAVGAIFAAIDFRRSNINPSP